MGFIEITVVWEGAVSDREYFDDVFDVQDMATFLAEVQSDASGSDDLVEVYEIHHDHEFDVDCECAQYLTDHSPSWTNHEA